MYIVQIYTEEMYEEYYFFRYHKGYYYLNKKSVLKIYTEDTENSYHDIYLKIWSSRTLLATVPIEFRNS